MKTLNRQILRSNSRLPGHRIRSFLLIGVIVFSLLPSCDQDAGLKEGVKISFDVRTRRSVGGVSTLDRQKYFNVIDDGLHFYESRVPSKEMGDYLLDSLRISFGHLYGLAGQIARSVTEDPERPGFADPGSVKKAAVKYRSRTSDAVRAKIPRLDDISPGGKLAWPEFMMGKPKGEREETDLPANPEAAAEFIALAFKECFDDWNRPRYIEFMNEYNYPKASEQQLNRFCEMHNTLALAIHKMIPDIYVGGPCFWYGNFHQNDFRDWNLTMKRYIDIAHRETDFYSFHNYDFYNGGKRNITSGTRTEAILDLVENYSLNTTGEIKPFVCGEAGVAGRDHWWVYRQFEENYIIDGADTIKNYMEYSYPEMTWHHIMSLNSQLMNYMNRPDRVLKIVPFTLVDVAVWRITAHWGLFRRKDFKPGAELLPTQHLKFYDLWKDVDGERIAMRSSDPDLQVQGFRDGKNVYLCMSNLTESDTLLNLDLPGELTGLIDQVLVRRIWFNGTDPTLEITMSESEEIRNMKIRADETVIIYLTLNDDPGYGRNINETFHYGNRTVVPIQPQAEKFIVEVPGYEETEYAELRIGISRHVDLDVVPGVTLNGQKLRVILEKSYSKQLINNEKEYAWGVRNIRVPVKLLEEENEIEIQFDDEGGYISSVVIMTGSEI